MQYFFLALFSIISLHVGMGEDSLFACLHAVFFLVARLEQRDAVWDGSMSDEWDGRLHLINRGGGET